MPYEVPTDTLCNAFKRLYQKFLKPVFEGRSNFPEIPEEGLCPLPKVNLLKS